MKVFIALLALFALAAIANATGNTATTTTTTAPQTYNCNTRTPHSQIASIISRLKAGDVLNFAAGVYVDLKLDLSGLAGRADAWIVIKGTNATLSCGGSVSPITIGACAYVKVDGLKVTTTGAKVIAGIKLKANIANLILTNLVIAGVNGHGIDCSNVDNVINVEISNCDISGTGKVSSSLGVAVVVGGISAAVKNVANIQVLNCVLHDILTVRASVQILLGVVAPRVVDNVCYNVKHGLHVVTGIVNDVFDLLPRVIGNLCLDVAGVGLNIGAGTQCSNNIVTNVDVGINLVLGGRVSVLANTTIAHNSVYKTKSCALQCLHGVPHGSLVIVNNALAVGSTVVGKVLNIVSGLLGSVAHFQNNVCQGPTVGLHLGVGVSLGLGKGTKYSNGLIVCALKDIFGGVTGNSDSLQLLPLPALTNNLVGAVADVVDQVGDIVHGIVGTVEQLVDNLICHLKELLHALGLGHLLNPVLNAVDDIVDDLLPGIDHTVEELFDGLEHTLPKLADGLEHLIDTKVNAVQNILTNVFQGLGKSFGGFGLHFGKRTNDQTYDVSGLIAELKKSLALVLGHVGGSCGSKLVAIDATLNALINGVYSGAIANVELDISLPGLKGLIHAVERLLEETLTDVDDLLAKVLGGLDFDAEFRLGKCTCGARQAGRGSYSTLGSFKHKLRVVAPRAVASIRSE